MIIGLLLILAAFIVAALALFTGPEGDPIPGWPASRAAQGGPSRVRCGAPLADGLNPRG
jgi:hypothetical protein